MVFGHKMFFAIYEESVNRLSVNIPNEVTFLYCSFLMAQSYLFLLRIFHQCGIYPQMMSKLDLLEGFLYREPIVFARNAWFGIILK